MMDSKVNILVVDDRSTNILLLTELLKNLDANIITALSGREALDLVKNLDLALALLDVQMPEMDGLELAIHLNKERAEHIPIIFVTATYPESDEIIEGYKAGAVDYIVKPFKTEVLISKVKVFIKLYLQKKELSEIAKELSITTRSLSEANTSLLVSKEEYQTLMNASPDVILLLGVNDKITDISQSTLSLFGTDNRNKIIGKRLYRFIASGQTEKIQEIRHLLETKGRAYNVELSLKKLDQTSYPVEVSVARIERQHGTPISYMLMIRDMTLRKSIESQLLHSDRLASLGEMASGMAHEINQPLNTISLVMDNMIMEAGASETLDKSYFEKKTKKIFESIQRIKSLIDHVRLFSHSNFDLINEPFDINESINNALNLMNEQTKQKGIHLQVNLAQDLPLQYGNTFELEQVLINLLSNARDALLDKEMLPDQKMPLCIQVRSYRTNGTINIDVTDNGTGIKEQDKDRLFLPFFSTKNPGKGTGLGLSISYTIVKNMNGEIQFESEYKKGTTFHIQFPIKKQTNHDNTGENQNSDTGR